MAKIFRVRDGMQDNQWGELPWPQCVEAFELDPSSGTDSRPTEPETLKRHHGSADRVIVRLEDQEAGQHGMKPGFFVSPLDGLAAKFGLDEISPDHVARLEAARKASK